MQSRILRWTVGTIGLVGVSFFLFAQQSDHPGISIRGVPGEPIATGDCKTSTFGYLELDGKRSGFTDAQFGQAIMSALREGYVITAYPPTKRGIFLNQDCPKPAP